MNATTTLVVSNTQRSPAAGPLPLLYLAHR